MLEPESCIRQPPTRSTAGFAHDSAQGGRRRERERRAINACA
jgi:hypothetical protein